VNIKTTSRSTRRISVWDAAKGPGKLQRRDEWNDVMIKIQRPADLTWVTALSRLDGAVCPGDSARGGIGFQRHGTPNIATRCRGEVVRDPRAMTARAAARPEFAV